jgi:two-component system KDP operon response regulator KdpE
MKNVLIVDDDQEFLAELTKTVQEGDEKFLIITASNGSEAIGVLDARPVDLVVTDLEMPDMKGHELLAHIANTRPGLPVIIFTSFDAAPSDERPADNGAFHYLEKSADTAMLRARFTEALRRSARGRIAGVSLPSFLQLLGYDKATCTLTVSHEDGKGAMFFRKGELIDATSPGSQGLEAAFEIIGWERPEIEISNVCARFKRVIQEPLGFILIESSRREDERKGLPAAADGDFEEAKEVDPLAVEEMELNAADLELIEPQEPDENEAGSSSSDPDLRPLLQAIRSQDSIARAAIVAMDGKILAPVMDPGDSRFGIFIAFINVAAQRVREIIGFRSPELISLTLESGNKLVVVPGDGILVALEIGGAANATAIAERIRPLVFPPLVA